MKLSVFLFSALLCSTLYAAERTVSYNFDGNEKFSENTGVFTPGVNGNALSFNGRQFAEVEWPLIESPKSLRIECDVFIEKTSHGTILACFEENGNNREFSLSAKNGVLSFAVNGSGKANNTSNVSLPVVLSQWVHVIARWQPGILQLQVNDQLKKVSGPKKLHDNPIQMQLGRYWAGRGMRFFSGKIDNLKIISSDEDNSTVFKKKIAPAEKDKLIADFDFSKWQDKDRWGKPEWQVILGRWNVQNGAYCQLASTRIPRPQLAIINQDGWEDYAVEALVKFLPGRSRRAGVGFRLQKSAPGFYPVGGYFADLEENEEKCMVRLYVWKQNGPVTIPPFRMERTVLAGSQDDPGCWNLLCEKGIKKDPDGEMIISVLCAGARIVVNVNGQTVLKANSGAFPKGTAGITAFDSNIALKRMFIRKLRPEEKEYASGIKLISPADGRSDNVMDPPLFCWQEIIDGEHDEKMDFCYDLQISGDRDFRNIIYQADTLYTLSHRPVKVLPAGKYYWRVRRRTPRGTMIWSPIRESSSAGKIRSAIFGEIVNRHAPAARPSWKIPVQGSAGEAVFSLDGQNDALEIKKNPTEWLLTPKQDIAWGAHTLTMTNGAEKRKWIVVRTELIEPVTLRKDGVLLVGGKPCFPVGTYRDPEDNVTDFKETLRANFNMTHSYWFEESGRGKKILDQDREYLDRAEKLGLTVFLGFSRKDAFAYGKRLDAEAGENIIRTAARRLTSKSYISGTPHEEPDGGSWGLPPRAVGQVSRLIKEADPFHLTHSLLYRPQGFLDYGQATDFIMIDPYPLPNEDLDQVYRRIVTARQLSGKPVWMVLQAFDYRVAGYIDSHVPAETEHRPTAKELRVMSYLALTAGAKGLIYYWWRNDVLHICKKYPYFYQAMADLVAEIRKLTPFLVSGEPAPQVFASDPNIRTGTFAHQGKILLIAVNPTGEARETGVAVTGKINRIMNFSLAPHEVKTVFFTIE